MDTNGGELTLPHPWSPYPAYLPPGMNLAKEDREREARRTAPFILIVYRSYTKAWKAVWTDRLTVLGRFDGTREEVIAWARERCDDIRICANPDEEGSPMVQLGPDD